MNGLALSRAFFLETALPDLRRRLPQAAELAAAGLVGNGSECFGFDDHWSRDHDWGIDFFLWLPEREAALLPQLRAWKEAVCRSVPQEYRKLRSAYGAQVGVQTVPDFYRSLIGCPNCPATLGEWLQAPEENLCMCCNGAVFADPLGEFTAVRQRIAAHYPPDIRYKRMAAACMRIAQSGQYNVPRMTRRQDWVAVQELLSQFIRHTMHLVFLLEGQYMPYYKWAWRQLETLPGLGTDVAARLRGLTETCGWTAEAVDARQEQIEGICRLLGQTLRERGVSDAADDFLLPHGEAIRQRIGNSRLRELPAQVDPFR